MPHIKLCVSNNILEREEVQSFFQACHKTLVTCLPTHIESCKSRLLVHDIFQVGDGVHHNAFIHLEVKVLPGRTQEVMDHTAKELLKLLEEYFARSLLTLKAGLSVELATLQCYHKA